MKVLMIGAGNMGLTYAEGMAKAPVLDRRNLMIHDISADKRQQLRKVEHFDVFEKLEDGLKIADIVFIAVKPYHSEQLFGEMKPHVKDEQIFVSLMAGVSLDTISTGVGAKKVVRTMPNLPAQVGKGVTSYTETKDVSRVERLMVRNLLDTTGEAIHVENENFINASTGISGSGPAYVFYFMQAMLEAALDMGFSMNDARVLVTHTFDGAIAVFNNADISPEDWMERVASKGGTTRAALDSMDDSNVKELIKKAARAAFDRATELGKE